MRERYIQMRSTQNYNLNWFYEYYVQEFPNIPQFWINKQGEQLERKLIPANEFMQPFQMAMSFQSAEIFDYLDKKFEVTKIEGDDGKLIYIN